MVEINRKFVVEGLLQELKDELKKITQPIEELEREARIISIKIETLAKARCESIRAEYEKQEPKIYAELSQLQTENKDKIKELQAAIGRIEIELETW